MKVIGLTGGIASGKSTVSKYLKDQGIPILDADQIAKDLVEVGEEGWFKLKEAFGERILLEDGKIDRPELGRIIFQDPEQRKVLNGILHPMVRARIDRTLEELRFQGRELAVVDVPLLIEAEMTDMVEEVWLVSTDLDTQIARLKARDQLNHAEALARINSQMSLEEKKKRATVIIDNSGSIEDTLKQINKLLEERRLSGFTL